MSLILNRLLIHLESKGLRGKKRLELLKKIGEIANVHNVPPMLLSFTMGGINPVSNDPKGQRTILQ